MPRIDPEGVLGLVTDVCLKRKIRNYIETVKEGEEGFKIYIREDVPLNRSCLLYTSKYCISGADAASFRFFEEIFRYTRERKDEKSHRTIPLYRDMERHGTVCKQNKEF